MKKQTLLLGEEESEDDQVSPHADGGSESGLKSGGILICEREKHVTQINMEAKEPCNKPNQYMQGKKQTKISTCNMS